MPVFNISRLHNKLLDKIIDNILEEYRILNVYRDGYDALGRIRKEIARSAMHYGLKKFAASEPETILNDRKLAARQWIKHRYLFKRRKKRK